MPIYEYACQDCGNTFKHLHRMLNEPHPPCPKCGNKNVKKIFSTFAVHSGGKRCESASEGHCCPAMSEGHCCPGCCHNH